MCPIQKGKVTKPIPLPTCTYWEALDYARHCNAICKQCHMHIADLPLNCCVHVQSHEINFRSRWQCSKFGENAAFEWNICMLAYCSCEFRCWVYFFHWQGQTRLLNLLNSMQPSSSTRARERGDKAVKIEPWTNTSLWRIRILFKSQPHIPWITDVKLAIWA